MITRRPIYPSLEYLSTRNNGNLHQYDPYMISDGKLVIDANWYGSLTEFNQGLIEKNLSGRYELGAINIPHEIQPDVDNLLETIHVTYIDSFDYHIWYKEMPLDNVNMVSISPELKIALMAMYRKLPFDANLIEQFQRTIDNVLPLNGASVFIRLSSTSGKNEQSIEPLYNSTDIIKRLTSIKLFVEKEYMRDKLTYLVIMPWVEIDPNFEFRVFIVNGKLVGLCKQAWFDHYQYSSDELNKIVDCISNVNFDGYPYKNFIADFYIDDSIYKLIELNPFGAHCGAGSGLFNWIDDHDLLYGLGKCEFRYLSVINYF